MSIFPGIFTDTSMDDQFYSLSFHLLFEFVELETGHNLKNLSTFLYVARFSVRIFHPFSFPCWICERFSSYNTDLNRFYSSYLCVFLLLNFYFTPKFKPYRFKRDNLLGDFLVNISLPESFCNTHWIFN